MNYKEFQVGDKVEVTTSSGCGHFQATVLAKETGGLVMIKNRQGRQSWVDARKLKCVLPQKKYKRTK